MTLKNIFTAKSQKLNTVLNGASTYPLARSMPDPKAAKKDNAGVKAFLEKSSAEYADVGYGYKWAIVHAGDNHAP